MIEELKSCNCIGQMQYLWIFTKIKYIMYHNHCGCVYSTTNCAYYITYVCINN